jgi:hypothetical protein
LYEAYINGRNSYKYPPIGLCASQALDDVANWKAVYKHHQFQTTLELDIHHNSHLTSDNDDEVLLGIYSVMYWGYITSGAKSVIRCDWLSVGNTKNKELSLTHLGKSRGVKIIRKSHEHLKYSRYSDALLEIRNLPHVGVSFGTKFLAFIDPENVGVLDDKITRHLASNSFDKILDKETLKNLIKAPHESAKAASLRFQAFCEALNLIKKELNDKKCKWKDGSNTEMCRFRAIDVERALFAIAKEIDNA